MSFFGQIAETWQALIDLIIRPPRHEYRVNRDLGPRHLVVQGKFVIRDDLELMNARGYILKCSHFQPAELIDLENSNDQDMKSRMRPQSKPFPCVVYCHGNAGSRVDAMAVLPILLPQGISVFAFDFAGAGQSEGAYLSLGFFEKDDLATVVDYLKSVERVNRIGLWGHSMGACTCLLYAANGGDQVVSAMVLDSSFSSLDAVISETAASAKQKLGESIAPAITFMPDMFIPMAVAVMRRSILSQAAFDIREVNPLSKCEGLLLPALFGHADDDEMVSPNHSIRLHESYGGNSTLIRFPGNHNSPRSEFFLSSALEFFRCILRPGDEEHPAEALIFHNATSVRGLMGNRMAAANRGKGFQSSNLSATGEKCFHVGRTASSLSILANMCLECNPSLRQKREASLIAAKCRKHVQSDKRINKSMREGATTPTTTSDKSERKLEGEGEVRVRGDAHQEDSRQETSVNCPEIPTEADDDGVAWGPTGNEEVQLPSCQLNNIGSGDSR
uniref:AB hydrolase-1 domain-containing protein n=1 Tax=Hanusia phi TaxID=3032 RepID=A0A7S0DUI0_9CRYP|mmetsp:Transcript_10399/g.23781  ORF Transcript_10399/g.23781 Transcript_10399/m.23781 type:complete len:503 (+) Transcript_10399:354-1862(+)